MRKLSIMILVFFIISLSACSNSNQELEKLKAENEKLKAELAENKNISTEPVTVNGLLDEFKDWDGNKTFGKDIYTLNLNKDVYILTIKPNSNENNVIDWMDMVYIKPIKNDTVITTDEISPMQKLVSIISPYWTENNQWMDNIIAKKIPYEEIHEGWKLNVDYYIYLNKKEGLVLTLSNLNKPQIQVETSKDTSTQTAVDSKRSDLANGIKSALNAPGHPPICNSVYFNKKGELIIEATSYWDAMSKSEKEDIIFLIKGILLKRKGELQVEGFGQFFSPAGRPLESFYAK